MKLEAALAALVTIEERMAGYYEWLARIFSEDDEARQCFATLAQQERGHAGQIAMQHRMIRSGRVVEEVQLEAEDIQELVKNIERFQFQNPKPPLGHAVLFALRLESGPIEQAYRDLLKNPDSALAKLARGMIQADEKHAKMLRDLMEKRRKV